MRSSSSKDKIITKQFIYGTICKFRISQNSPIKNQFVGYYSTTNLVTQYNDALGSTVVRVLISCSGAVVRALVKRGRPHATAPGEGLTVRAAFARSLDCRVEQLSPQQLLPVAAWSATRSLLACLDTTSRRFV